VYSNDICTFKLSMHHDAAIGIVIRHVMPGCSVHVQLTCQQNAEASGTAFIAYPVHTIAYL
jgi:hypothetical protein